MVSFLSPSLVVNILWYISLKIIMHSALGSTQVILFAVLPFICTEVLKLFLIAHMTLLPLFSPTLYVHSLFS